LSIRHDAAIPEHNQFPAVSGSETPAPGRDDFNASNETAETTGLLTADPEVETDTIPEFDTAGIVEAAEQLLRESAPHDFQVLVIGGGGGGYAAALRAAELGAQVGLVEAKALGGSYLDEFIPTHAFLSSAHSMRNGGIKPDFAQLQKQIFERVEAVRAVQHDALAAANVTVIEGFARFVDEHCVEVRSESETRRLKAVHVVIAIGAGASGSDSKVVDRCEFLRRAAFPPKLAILGGEASAIEMAYLCQTFGAQVTLLFTGETLFSSADGNIQAAVARILHSCGVEIGFCESVRDVRSTRDGLIVEYDNGNKICELPTDAVVQAGDYRVDEMTTGLQAIGVAVKNGRIQVDKEFETNINGVYAIGGCVHGACEPQLARAEGRQVAEQVCGYPRGRKIVPVPWSCGIDPAAAGVGLTEAEAKRNQKCCGVGLQRLVDLQGLDGSVEGFVKVLIDGASGIILGCHAVGPGAVEIIDLAAVAMAYGVASYDILAQPFVEFGPGDALRAAIKAAH